MNLAVAREPFFVTAGDFNKDGKADIAVANSASNVFSLIYGSGKGRFAKPLDYVAGAAPIAIASGNFVQGGGTDFALVNYNSNNVSLITAGSPDQLLAAVCCSRRRRRFTQSPRISTKTIKATQPL